MKITIYGKRVTPILWRLKILRMAEIPFTYKDVISDDEAKAHSLKIYDGSIKFPTLIVDEEIYKTPSTDDFNRIMKDLKLRG